MSNEKKISENQQGHAPLAGVSDCSCEDHSVGFDPDDYCKKCGSSAYYEDCWKCGGEGGRDGEDLMEEDPLWYSPDDFEVCDECNGTGSFKMCLNSECCGE